MEVDALQPSSRWLPAGPVFLRKFWRNKTVNYVAWTISLGLVALATILFIQAGSLFIEACGKGWVQLPFCATD